MRRHGEHIALCHNNTSYIEVRETMEHLPSTLMREDVRPHFLSSAVFSLLRRYATRRSILSDLWHSLDAWISEDIILIGTRTGEF